MKAGAAHREGIGDGTPMRQLPSTAVRSHKLPDSIHSLPPVRSALGQRYPQKGQGMKKSGSQ